MTVTWVKNPSAILAEDAAGGVVINADRIVELVPGGAVPRIAVDEVVEARDHVVLPGLINTHHHSFQSMTRAHPYAVDKPLFDWLASLYPVWRRYTPQALHLATRTAYAELLLSGCTTVADHHYLYPKGLESAVDIQVEAARDLGVRAVITRGSMSDRDGGVTPIDLTEDEDDILADCERALRTHHDVSDGAMVQIGLAPCSPFNVTPDLLARSAGLAEQHSCGLHTHCGETLDEIDYCQRVFGRRPLDHLEEAGWLRPGTWLAHGIHFTDGEISRLGAAGAGVAHCPTSNMLLSSGIARTIELEQAGVAVGLGVDGSASNDRSNLLESARHALLLGKLHYGAAAVSHLDVLRWGTQGSAACLRRSDIGTITTGKQADLAFFRIDDLRFAGAHDPLAALVLCGADRADRVMVAGHWRVLDGNVVGIDIEDLARQQRILAHELFGTT